jgi:hypothetical protein
MGALAGVMNKWRRYLELQAQAKSGLSSALLVGGMLGVVSAAITFAFLLVAAFVWLAQTYDPLTAGLGLGVLFLLITIITLAYCLWLHRRTIERAQLALAAGRNAPWLDPRLLGGAVQLGRAVDLRRFIPLVVVGFLAAGVAMQWIGRDRTDLQHDSM